MRRHEHNIRRSHWQLISTKLLVQFYLLSPNRIPTRHDMFFYRFSKDPWRSHILLLLQDISCCSIDSVRTHGDPVFHFCIKTMNENTEYERDWPKGSYCILKKGDCPQGLITTMHLL